MVHLQVHSRIPQGDQACLIVAHGELDLSNARELRNTLVSCLENSADLHLDLREVPYMDCTALSTILTISRSMKKSGHHMVVSVAPGSAPQRIMLLSHADRQVDLRTR
jgi:anti-anti-sigma factor